MDYPKVCLRRGEEAGVLKGQKLIYDNELDWADDICIDGCVVDVLDSRQHFVARGFFNARSKLTVRVLTRRAEETIDCDFFARRIRAAWQTRQTLGFSDSCRVVFGESDGLPGLTVDKFADCLSFQIACLGLEQWKETLVEILAEIFAPRGIYERDDLPVREKEGLPLIKTCVYGEVPEELVIQEHDAHMLVSIANGQKTGHFLDQQENRGRLKPYAPGQDVLDLCCCTGGFSIHAALYGAKSVEAVDVSESALALVRENAALNGIGKDRLTVRQGDATKEGPLRDAIDTGYDVVVANIVADVIIRLAPFAYPCCKPGSPFIVSGVIDERRDEVREALEKKGYTFLSAEPAYIPSTYTALPEDAADKMTRLMDLLDDCDDVQGFWHNWEM